MRISIVKPYKGLSRLILRCELCGLGMESLPYCICLETIRRNFVERLYNVKVYEKYTCKNFGYSDWLPPVDVGEFLLSEPRKHLCLFV